MCSEAAWDSRAPALVGSVLGGAPSDPTLCLPGRLLLGHLSALVTLLKQDRCCLYKIA